jgi:hypothetical protein
MEIMTKQNKDQNHLALLRLADEMVDDILSASDEEVLAEFKELHGDPVAFANKMRSKISLLEIQANRERLLSAQHALALEKELKKSLDAKVTSQVAVDVARRALENFFSKASESLPITVAARKEKIQEMSDFDVLGMVSDLEALGFVLRKKATSANE